MQTLAICSIVRNEERYLQEWIEWHLCQGVDFFYLYDDHSTDRTPNIIQYYEKLGYAKYSNQGFLAHSINRQREAMQDYIRNRGFCYQGAFDWTAFIDADEFLQARDPWFTFKEQFLEFTQRTNATSVLLPWLLFGSNGHERYDPDSLVLERFTKCGMKFDQHVKTIAKTIDVKTTSNNVHRFEMRGGTAVNADGKVSEDGPWQKIQTPEMWINHYHTKSRHEYKERCARGRCDTDQKRDFNVCFPAHDQNEMESEKFENTFLLRNRMALRKWKR